MLWLPHRVLEVDLHDGKVAFSTEARIGDDRTLDEKMKKPTFMSQFKKSKGS
jgi:hypothetical protein